jgi:tetratricopeptide (TPR) repeat protein
MNLAEYYQLLGLSSGASFEDIKASYRRLARQYHPDVSSGDQRAKDKFIEVTLAYKTLLNALSHSGAIPLVNPVAAGRGNTAAKRGQVSPAESPPPSRPQRAVQIQLDPQLSPLDNQIKLNSYQQLQILLRSQRFPRAIALVEGLARRFPQDREIAQWQAIVYQQWGRQLIRDRQIGKARLYLKKALQTDPQNRALWAEVEKDFRYIEQLF